jgi:hypothetical protein
MYLKETCSSLYELSIESLSIFSRDAGSLRGLNWGRDVLYVMEVL